ncbi:MULTISPECIES: DUF4810 domain-containing protein [Paraburkholderia]|uniref:DUF4810 domain-containing protein n=5 Tax=Paraburkholderia TaxID=1822464 RepID=A0A4R0X820_9BURK|nr:MULTISPECIES: DUF4810 domain-containing protein [Paraburkholderia]EUC14418.1 hypothetical protein PMI06_006829 [Burkholderia sp. BT03]SKC80740.1 hypothetical protein SAMN05445504_2945 [Burkholderia sp. CF099]AUT60140.1 DUF4810 domain-containing protein [Paraburkholderia terrae]AXE99127.1 DUF4810 domain-containing protein [Paraburkholderia hospita]MDW3662070.1 DUF4810 domain-containing protein [Paraburkholderia terrae]
MLKRTNMLTGIALPVAAACALLSGCANTKSVSLYQWDGYQPQVYEYFKGQKSPLEQIDALEKARQQILAKGASAPPGFHAHLGMLYATVGKDQEAKQELLAEKQSFPESSTYMDFLLSKFQ